MGIIKIAFIQNGASGEQQRSFFFSFMFINKGYKFIDLWFSMALCL